MGKVLWGVWDDESLCLGKVESFIKVVVCK